ncbi:hypothetical protein V6N11_068293 [Hibiscus sabdariffa]|uniref:Uncharacterized protein n=1 Tax=Hibiscus sabdariffa TaxID=183260 RepID=A0ABR2A0U3_9ROSI
MPTKGKPTDFEKLPSLEVEGETTAGNRKIEVTPEVDFLNVGFVSKANINERRLWDIAGLEEVGGVLGADVHDYSPGAGTTQYAVAGASSWNLNYPISRASVETYTSSDNAHGEEIENVQVDGSLCEMVSRDNNNISWAEGVDRAMNAKNGWTGVAFDHALESDNLDFFPEFKDTRNRKKYASLYDLQDKVLSAREKKIRDRAFKKIKNSKKVVKEVDFNESSPSESNIVRTQALIRSEKNTLEFGKKLDFQFIGNEDDVIMDMNQRCGAWIGRMKHFSLKAKESEMIIVRLGRLMFLDIGLGVDLIPKANAIVGKNLFIGCWKEKIYALKTIN